MAGGLAPTYAEYNALGAQPLASHLASFILLAMFEALPGLKVVLVGGGATWIPQFIWRLDYIHKLNERESAWLKKQGWEYFRDHVKVATYQLETVPPAPALGKALGTLPWFDQTLVYASGYPNWDWEEPDTVVGRLPEAWRDRVLRENALDTFRWPDRARAGARLDD
jgi:predicted TIM-barrel fold metal-dependent hydrolase